jgi:molybdopterin molybdotransferase
MTGAVMPAGTDTVIMQERTEIKGNHVVMQVREKSGANVRYAGEDVREGDVVFVKGTRLGASQLGVLASLGMAEVKVFRKPRVAYFSNGDELRAVGTPLKLGEVYDSNRYTLHAMLDELNVDEIDLGVVPDDKEAIAETIRKAAEMADLVITTAGASVGDADYIKEILTELGQVSFWKVAIKPGRPLSFGRLGDALFFGLPGNPVSVMVTFQIFLKPAIRQLAGEASSVPTILKMRTTADLRKKPGRMEYQRGILSQAESGETVVSSTGEQGSGILSSMTQANCFIILPDDSDGAKAGDWVEVQPFDYGA